MDEALKQRLHFDASGSGRSQPLKRLLIGSHVLGVSDMEAGRQQLDIRHRLAVRRRSSKMLKPWLCQGVPSAAIGMMAMLTLTNVEIWL